MSREKTEKDYEKHLNDLYGDIDVCGMIYPAGQVLRKIDPIAFDLGFSDWSSEEEDEEVAGQ